MDHDREIVSLNIKNLDIQELERRLELASGLVATPDGWVCGADCGSNCTGYCPDNCIGNCPDNCIGNCTALCAADVCNTDCGALCDYNCAYDCSTNYCVNNYYEPVQEQR